ncbi:hypothetical protein L7F22_040885 [Adiantum nelumboides]|nr:hypothetical protein [Adiantum nelumboides]
MYIWYASYGSNMWKDRFMCYIQGGQVESMKAKCLGARNKTPPVDTSWIQVQNEIFFGHSYTQTWGQGGVAFLDTQPTTGTSTHIHLYKITLDQFNDLFLQENRIISYDQDLINKPCFLQALTQKSSASIANTILKEQGFHLILALQAVPLEPNPLAHHQQKALKAHMESIMYFPAFW